MSDSYDKDRELAELARRGPPPRIEPHWRWRKDVQKTTHEEETSLDTVDLRRVSREIAEDPGYRRQTSPTAEDLPDDDARVLEALQLAEETNLDEARAMAEEVLASNPNSAPALYVNAAECESRQDWSEAARFFLVGLGHNGSDPSMEHGFQTNVDMLRSQRMRHFERPTSNKWDDVLTFKPRPPVVRPPSPEDKPPWWRLGPYFEDIVQDGGYLDDLVRVQADPAAQRMELRRILYKNLDFLDMLYAHYRDDINDTRDPEQLVPAEQKHTGHLSHDDEEPLELHGFWRILKECRVVYGDVKSKMPVAVFDRVLVMSKRRSTRLQNDPAYDLVQSDPHDRWLQIPFYDFIEVLVRTGYARLQGTLSHRFEMLIAEHLRPYAMRRQADKSFLEFRNPNVQNMLLEPNAREKLRKVFDFFVVSYKSNKVKSTVIGTRDITMNLNHVLAMMDRFEAFDPQYNVKKCVDS